MNPAAGAIVAESPPGADTAESLRRDDIRSAYVEYNHGVRITGAQNACMLVVVLMPAGHLLDYFVYPAFTRSFFLLRIICAALALGVWAVLKTGFGARHLRLLAMATFVLPTFFISLMIYLTEGAHSTYYAGLNLVLIGLSWVSLVEFFESFVSAGLTLFMYGAACVAHGGGAVSDFTVGFYFIALTGVIVVTGSYFLNIFRFQEYCLRQELDHNRRELEQSNAKLEESNAKLVDLDRAKSTFFANVSHELRTPLTLLIGPLDRLRRRNPAPTPHEHVEMLDIMYNNAMRLLRLINDLLELVRLDSGGIRVRREKVALLAFLEGIAKSVAPMAAQRKLQFENAFEVAADSTVWMDRDKVEKVVLNLLFNSFKFTPESGRVDFTGTLKGSQLLLSVRDTGRGISPEDLPRVFDRFWQAEAASTRRYQGVGIGLALVKELTEAHGGRVSVQSELGKGTEIQATFDVAQGAEPESPNSAEPTPLPVVESEWLVQLYRRAELFPAHVLGSNEVSDAPAEEDQGKPLVLIADDEPEMRRFLHSQLKDIYAIREARNGSEALDLAKANDFVLILLDLMMPGIDGITLTRLLREEPRTVAVPVVILTARADEDSKMQALEAGVTDFLTKPFSTSEMAVRCRNLVLQQQLQQRLAVKTRELEAALVEIKQTETQLVHQAKMASLGQLSSGLLHEINNPLNFANTAFHVLQKRLSKAVVDNREPLEAPMRDLQDGIRRVAEIVSGLRSFTHPDTLSFGEVRLREVVADAARFVQVGGDIAVENNLTDDHRAWGNRNQLIHLFINLLQNASDSLREKGAPEKKIKISAVLQNGSVVLSCEDNGIGIPAEDRSKVFDAFFTTKPVGSGVGLGLNICHRIIQNHRGDIQIESQENEYCRFIITFKRFAPTL